MEALIEKIELSEEDKETLRVFGERCISEDERKPCYGKPCACLVCHHEDFFCVEDPCYGCEGKGDERTSGFCVPDDYDLGNYTR